MVIRKNFLTKVVSLFITIFFLSLLWSNVTNAMNVDCKALYNNKEIKKDFIGNYDKYIKCGYYNDFTFKATPTSDYVLTERFELTWTDRLMLLNSAGKTWIYKNLDKTKTYTIDLYDDKKEDNTVTDFWIKISDGNTQVLNIKASNTNTLPFFDLKNIIIVTLDNTTIKDLTMLYSSQSVWKPWSISVTWINATNWYQSDWTCKWTDCKRSYFYNWYLGSPDNWKIEKVILNIYYDFNHNWKPDNGDLVYTTSYTLPNPLDISEANVLFDSKYKSIDINTLTRLKFTDWLKLTRIKFINDLIDWTFIIKWIKKETLLPPQVAAAFGAGEFPNSCIDLWKMGIKTNWFYKIFPFLASASNVWLWNWTKWTTQSIWIKQDSNWIKLWADGTYAKDCSWYKFPDDGIHTYAGYIWDGFYWVKINNKKIKVYCDMTTDWGWWTLVSKIKDWSDKWYYNSNNWTSNTTINEAALTDIKKNEDYKNDIFNYDSQDQARFCMWSISNCLVEDINNTTLKDIFASNTEISSNNTRKDYLDWSWTNPQIFDNEPNCNKSWFNLNYKWFSIRYGISMNNENDCNSNDTYIWLWISNYWQNWGNTWWPNSSWFRQRNNSIKYQRQGWIWTREKPSKKYNWVEVYCDFTTPGGPYWFKAIDNWKTIRYTTDSNSCQKYWLALYTPTNWHMTYAKRNFIYNIMNNSWQSYSSSNYGAIGVYNKDHNSDSWHSGGWSANREMVSWNTALPSWWLSKLWNTVQWYLVQTDNIGEPNGDYYKNALLWTYYNSNNNFLKHINDEKNDYTYNYYICVDKSIAKQYDYTSEQAKSTTYKSCENIKKANPTYKNWYYWIKPDWVKDNHPVKVYCDMTTNWGGWTMVDVKTRDYWTRFYDKLNAMWIKYSSIMLEDIDHLTVFDQNDRNSSWNMDWIPFYTLQFINRAWKIYMVWQRNRDNSQWNSNPWRGWSNRTPDYFIPFNNVKIVKPSSWECLFWNTNMPWLCAEKVIILFWKTVKINNLTDLESYSGVDRGDNSMKAYFKIYVR